MVFVALGLLVGNRFLELIEVDTANQYVRLLAEATLTLVLFTDAARVNLGSLRRQSALPARLLGLGLPLTIVAGTLAGLAVFPQLDLWTAAALATILAPTDAALGLPVVSNTRLPSRIRQGLNVESGLNDGACVPLLIIFLTIAQAEEGVGHIEPFRVVLEEIGFGVVGGVLAGALGAWVLRRFAARSWMEGTWQQINAVATPLLAYTVAVGLGGSGFIAAFTAGIVFGAVAGEWAEHSTFLAEQSGSCSTRSPSCCSGRCCSAQPLASWTGGSPCTRSGASPWYACSRSPWPCWARACVGSRSGSWAGSGPAVWPRSCSC
jgi:NhaP-type Na+/H+ or K+/H+ antiporter